VLKVSKPMESKQDCRASCWLLRTSAEIIVW